jgi:hypothetical protein
MIAALGAGLAACGRLGYDAFDRLGDDDGGAPGHDAAPDPTTDAAPGADAGPTADATMTGPTTDEVQVSEPVTGSALDPVLAWTGHEYLLVWDDNRDGNRELYFAAVGTDGLKQGADVRVTQASGYSGYPSVAWNGSQLGVAWEDGRLGSDEVFFTRLDVSGATLGTQSPLSSASGLAYDPTVVWSGGEFGVAWEDNGINQSEIFFGRAGADNLPVATPVEITVAAGRSMRPSAAWTGTDVALAWEDDRSGAMEMRFARQAGSGAVPGNDTGETTGGSPALGASLAWNGSHLALAWEDTRAGNSGIYLVLLQADGTRLGPDLPVSQGAGDATEASLVWASDHWAVAFLQAGRVMLAEVPPLGLPIAAPREVAGSTGDADNPELVWADGVYGLTWQDRRAGGFDVYFRQVAP